MRINSNFSDTNLIYYSYYKYQMNNIIHHTNAKYTKYAKQNTKYAKQNTKYAKQNTKYVPN